MRATIIRNESNNIIIQFYMSRINFSRQLYSFQTTATTKRYISLSMSKDSRTQINDNLIKRLSLALMDSDSPSKCQRYLSKRTYRIGIETFFARIVFIMRYLPSMRFHLYFFSSINLNNNEIFFERNDFS